ncbi:5321_t:CDS:1 [Paraglomus brasilianum]|uniref:5321_t:CDS:1 n=1 Tax=Paraglomus brasilianum TaxID=144538 RepID=A0A9N9B4E9_9GLOM|nr:5321_t:CDS:1 [Paraglomus brasilianum]
MELKQTLEEHETRFTKLEYDVSLIKEEKDKNANILQNPVNTQVSISDDTPEINSDIYEDLVIPTSPIPAEAISLEEKEKNKFLNLRYKEQVGKEIMERIREKK